MARFLSALLVLLLATGFAAAPAQAQIRVGENPSAWSSVVKGCDFESLVRELRITVRESRDEKGPLYAFGTALTIHPWNFWIEFEKPCPLESVERSSFKNANGTGEINYYKFTLAYLSDFPLEMGEKDGYALVLKRSVIVRLDLGALRPEELKERLYKTMGPVALKGRLEIGYDRCGMTLDWPRSVSELCYLVLTIRPSELNGIKLKDPLAGPYEKP